MRRLCIGPAWCVGCPVRACSFEITTRIPRNRLIRIGAAWEQSSKRTGTQYLSLKVMVNGQKVRVNAQRSEDDPKGEYRLVPLSG